MGVEHPQAPTALFELDLRYCADSGVNGKHCTAGRFRLFGKPKGPASGYLDLVVFDDDVRVLIVVGLFAAQTTSAENAVPIQQLFEVLAHIGQKLLHPDNLRIGLFNHFGSKLFAGFPAIFALLTKIPPEIKRDDLYFFCVCHR